MECSKHPHGGRRSVFAMVLGISAFLVLSVNIFSCIFMEIDGYLLAQAPFVSTSLNELYSSKIGLFRYQKFSEFGSSGGHLCEKYNDDQLQHLLDGPFKTARAFAAIAIFCVTVGTLALLILSCTFVEHFLLQIFGYIFIIGGIFELLVFIVFASDVAKDQNAVFWWGSGLTIVGGILSCIVGIIMLGLPQPFKEESTSSTPSSKTLQHPECFISDTKTAKSKKNDTRN